MRISKFEKLFSILVLLILIAGCRATPTPFRHTENASLPSPVGENQAAAPTATATPVSSPTLSPTLTNTPIPPPTLTPTPVQLAYEKLTSQNFSHFGLLKTLGIRPGDVFLAPDQQTAAVRNDDEICFYKTDSLLQEDCIHAREPGLPDFYSYPDNSTKILQLAPDFHFYTLNNKDIVQVYSLPAAQLAYTLETGVQQPARRSVFFSADGQLLLTYAISSTEKTRVTTEVALWNLSDGSRRSFFKNEGEPFDAQSLSPDHTELVLRRLDSRDLGIWNTSSGELLYTIHTFFGTPDKVVFSSTSEFFSVAYNGQPGNMQSEPTSNGLVMVFNAADGKPVWSSYGSGPVRDMAFSPDGQFFTFVSKSRQIDIYKVKDWSKQQTLHGQPKFGYSGVLFAPDGQIVVGLPARCNGLCFEIDRSAYFWNRTDARLILQASFDSKRALAFSTDSSQFILSTDFDLGLWQMDRIVQVVSVPYGAGKAKFSHDGNLVAVAVNGGLIQLWDAHSGTLLTTLGKFDPQPVGKYLFPLSAKTLVFSSGDRYLLARYNDGAVRLFDLTQNAQSALVIQLPETEYDDAYFAAAFSPDDQRLAIIEGQDLKDYGGQDYRHRPVRLHTYHIGLEVELDQTATIAGLRRYYAPGDLYIPYFTGDGRLGLFASVYKLAAMQYDIADLFLVDMDVCLPSLAKGGALAACQREVTFTEPIKGSWVEYDYLTFDPNAGKLSGMLRGTFTNYACIVIWRIQDGAIANQLCNIGVFTSFRGNSGLVISPDWNFAAIRIVSEDPKTYVKTSYSEIWDLHTTMQTMILPGFLYGEFSPDGTLFLSVHQPVELFGIKNK